MTSDPNGEWMKQAARNLTDIERYEAVETLSTYGENESFRVCVQIRTISGKAEGLHA